MAFSPYHKWLGIPAKDCPPNYYRLLNIELFETDLDVIEGAADKQISFVRQYQSGEHAADAAKVLNELARARLCLLVPKKKEEYDAKLREEFSISSRPMKVDESPLPRVSKRKRTKPAKPTISQGTMVTGGIAAVVVVVGAIFLFGRGRSVVEQPRQPNPIAEKPLAQPIESPPPVSMPKTEVASAPSPVIPPSQSIPVAPDLNQNKPAQNPDAKIVAKEQPTTPQPDAVTTVEQPSDPMPSAPAEPVTDPTSDNQPPPIGASQGKTATDLENAIASYAREKDALDKSVRDFLETREANARKNGDKKAIDQITEDKESFENWNVIPSNVPTAILKRRTDARVAMEKAFDTAVKSFVKAKDDDGATKTELKLRLFRSQEWHHLDLGAAKFKGDAFQISDNSSVSTSEEFTGSIDICAIARTEKNNIRLCANSGSSVIFNWEGNRKELRVTRPDGDDRRESGSLMTARVNPLTPNVWYKLRWRLTTEGMAIYVNDQPIFSESKTYDLSRKSKIKIVSIDSALEVRDFHVVVLPKK